MLIHLRQISPLEGLNIYIYILLNTILSPHLDFKSNYYKMYIIVTIEDYNLYI